MNIRRVLVALSGLFVLIEVVLLAVEPSMYGVSNLILCIAMFAFTYNILKR